MDNPIRIGINGFGRIGRSLTRVLQNRTDMVLVAVNDLAPTKTLAHLLKYDSIHGRYPAEIKLVENAIFINGRHVIFTQHENPADIPWQDAGVDVVIEATGRFKTKQKANAHLHGGVKKVIISAPADESVRTIVLGVNQNDTDRLQEIVSNASCTTNCAAPMVKIIDEALGIESAYVTTVHSYTTDQKLHDSPHEDLRRARAATLSMVPTTTGAAKALSVVFPHLEGRLGGCGIRVPVPDGSLTDITFHVKKSSSVEEVNNLFLEASKGKLKGVLGFTDEPLVSVDILGCAYSCLFDSQLTSVLGKMVKIVGWYDNEMGYSNRLADLIIHINNK